MASERSSSPSTIGHSRHMRNAALIGMVIAHTKQQSEVQLGDMIAGIYVANFERVLRFWPDAATFEDFVAEHCNWSENRLSTWDRWTYEQMRHPFSIGIPFTRWFFSFRSKRTFTGKMFAFSDELKQVYSTIEQLSPNKVTMFERVVPLITPELFLLATTRTEGVELGKRMIEAGLRLSELEQAALKVVEAPNKFMF